MNAIAIIPEQFIFASENELKTTSIKVAEAFGKQHAHVLRSIKNLECSDEFRQSNFGLSSYINEQKKSQPMYEMTKDGFMFLVMGFTGKAAAAIKEAYINAFNLMAAQLFGKRETAEPPTKLAYQGKLTLDQQDAIKALVKERVEELPKEKQAKAAITCWSSIKSKYGCGYKDVASDQFASVLSLIARLPLQGDVLTKEEKAIPFDISPRWFMHYNSDNRTMTCKPISPDCIVVEPERIAEVIADPSGSVYKKDLAAIITAIAKRLSD